MHKHLTLYSPSTVNSLTIPWQHWSQSIHNYTHTQSPLLDQAEQTQGYITLSIQSRNQSIVDHALLYCHLYCIHNKQYNTINNSNTTSNILPLNTHLKSWNFTHYNSVKSDNILLTYSTTHRQKNTEEYVITHLYTCTHVPTQMKVLNLWTNSTQMVLLLDAWKNKFRFGAIDPSLYLAVEER